MKMSEIENQILLELPPKNGMPLIKAKDDALARQSKQLSINKKQQQISKTQQRIKDLNADLTKLRNPNPAKPNA